MIELGLERDVLVVCLHVGSSALPLLTFFTYTVAMVDPMAERDCETQIS